MLPIFALDFIFENKLMDLLSIASNKATTKKLFLIQKNAKLAPVVFTRSSTFNNVSVNVSFETPVVSVRHLVIN